jgi:hypothetical protein
MIPQIGRYRIKILTLATLVIGLSACDGSYSPGAVVSANGTNANPTPVSSVTTSNGGIVCGDNAFCVNVVPPKDTTMILHADGNYTQPCSLSAGQDVACILDADELDLYAQGMTLNYNVPAGMCSYMLMQPYFYYAYQPGYGPKSVNLTVDPTTGAVTETDSGDGYPSANTATTTKVTVQQPYSTTPLCSADYTLQGGPNCCGGNYTLTVIQGGTPTVTTASWGGNPNNCLTGPAMATQTPEVAPSGNPINGYPKATLFTLDGNSLNSTYTVASPLSQGLGSNVYVSNFWQSGVTNNYPLTAYNSAAGAPNAMQGPGLNAAVYSSGCYHPSAAPAGDYICTGNPWYEFDCLDAAQDNVARIRVMVRSWTYEANFQNFIATQNNSPATGTYNYWGPEPLFPDQPIEDKQTWVTPYSGTLGAGVTGTVTAPCSNNGSSAQNCGYGSMYPGADL